jgi:cytoskeletal protein RodZ
MTVGMQLKAARQQRHLSLADVSRDTKIQPWVLEALEADRLQEMMSAIYVKGFLATYGRFLRLAPEALLAQLQWPASADVAAPAAATVSAAAAAAPAPQRPTEEIPSAIQWPEIPWRLLGRLGLGVAAAVALVAVVRVNPIRSTPKSSAAKVTQKLAPPASKEQAVAPKPKLASVAPVTEPLQVVAAPSLAVVPTQQLELGITANSTTWIQVKADGKLVSQQRLARGAKERWVARKSLEVVVAKPSQIDITLNGQSISPLAIAHQGRLAITHKGVNKLPEEPL